MTALSRPTYVTDSDLDRIIQAALADDIGTGDLTSNLTIPAEHTSVGTFLAKESGVVAGLEVAARVFQLLDPNISLQWAVVDGSKAESQEAIGTITGSTRSILAGERLALNFMQRMSGIATKTALFVEAVKGQTTRILDTRKTAPGLRVLDKWGVLLGGGENHRVGLFDMILIKDNHIAAAGGVENAIAAASNNHEVQIEIEAKTLDQVIEIIHVGGIDRILLDNMASVNEVGVVDTSRLEKAVRLVDGRFDTEASGNITLDTVGKIAATGVNFVSSGALTHSVVAFDISLDLGT